MITQDSESTFDYIGGVEKSDRKEDKMVGIDEISERLTNRFIRKDPAGCDELEYYQ